jgi:uridylate kinase
MKTGYTILSVGGSIVIPKTGFDPDFLRSFRTLIVKEVKKGKKFILVIGGGATARQYQAGAKSIGIVDKEDLDYVGIAVTRLNAELVRYMFKGLAHHEVVVNPTKKIKTTKPIIVACGWKPGCSTDTDAVLLARTYGVRELFNLSNIDYVYTADPAKDPSATKIEQIGWKEFRKIVGNVWNPGANVPFDPVASKMAEKLKLKVGFVKGSDLSAVGKAIGGNDFPGTIIC